MKFVAGAALALLLIGGAVLLGGTNRAGSWTGTSDAPQDLLGRSFVSASVVEDGRSRRLVAGTRIEVSFSELDGETWVGWSAGCNRVGVRAVITSDRIQLVGDTWSTLIGCLGTRAGQDAWVSELFHAEPRWELAADHLRLSVGVTVIEFVEHDPPAALDGVGTLVAHDAEGAMLNTSVFGNDQHP